MAQWLSFSVLAAVLTVVLLILARQSQGLLQDSLDEQPETTAGESALTENSKWEGPPDVEDLSPRAHGTNPVSGSIEHVLREPAQSSGRATSERARRTKSAEQIELTPAMLLANVAVTQGLVAVVILAAAWYFSIPAEAFGVTSAPLSTGIPAVVGGLIFGVVLWIGNEISTSIADAVGAAYDEAVREMLAPDSPGGWAVLFGVVLPIIAIAEELLFRAALIGVPAAGFDVSPWLLAVISSVAFAFGHGAQGRVGIVVTGLLGLVLAAGYILTGSLLLVVVAHYVINGLEFFVHEYLDVEIAVFGLDFSS